MATAKNTICLWFDKDAEEAARFYASVFPDSEVNAVFRAPSDFPSGKAGDVLTVNFTVTGIPCLGLNGGPVFTHNESFSFQIATGTTEGVYFPVGQAVAGLVSHPLGVGRCDTATVCGPAGVVLSARSSLGGADNIRTVNGGLVDSGRVQEDDLRQGLRASLLAQFWTTA